MGALPNMAIFRKFTQKHSLMKGGGMEIIKGHWDFAPSKKIFNKFQGCPRGHFKNGHFG